MIIIIITKNKFFFKKKLLFLIEHLKHKSIIIKKNIKILYKYKNNICKENSYKMLIKIKDKKELYLLNEFIKKKSIIKNLKKYHF